MMHFVGLILSLVVTVGMLLIHSLMVCLAWDLTIPYVFEWGFEINFIQSLSCVLVATMCHYTIKPSLNTEEKKLSDMFVDHPGDACMVMLNNAFTICFSEVICLGMIYAMGYYFWF